MRRGYLRPALSSPIRLDGWCSYSAGRSQKEDGWSVPGGHVEPGESFADAAAREALEETGLEVSIGRELPTVTIPSPDGRVFGIQHFAATVADGELVPGDDADDARWISPAELRGIPLTADLLEYRMCSGIVPDPSSRGPLARLPGQGSPVRHRIHAASGALRAARWCVRHRLTERPVCEGVRKSQSGRGRQRLPTRRIIGRMTALGVSAVVRPGYESARGDPF